MVLAVLSSLLPARAPADKPDQSDPQQIYAIAADAADERTHSSAHFSVTWIDDASSPDAPPLKDAGGDGVPDSVQRLLDAFEAARSFLVGELQYAPSPVTGPYRVYVAGREGRAATKPLAVVPGSPRPAFTVMPTSMLVGRQPQRALRLLAVHEYFHAIQNGYDSGYDHWIGEASSTWAEELFDDRANPAHHILDEFIPFPRQSLTAINGESEYGAFLFIQFLVERFAQGDPGIVRELWEHIATTDAVTAIETVLQRRGVALADAWTEFQLWRWDLDRFREGESYLAALGSTWPKPLQITEVANESCALSSDRGTALPPLSGDYSVFRPARRNGRAVVTLQGGDDSTAFVLVERQGGKERVRLLRTGASGVATASVRFGSDQIKRVVLGVGNASIEDEATFGYSLRVQGREAVAAQPLSPPADTHYFGGLTLRGSVLCDGKREPAAAVVLVQEMSSGELRTFPLTTDPSGSWVVNLQPQQTSTYHVEVVDPLISEATSAPWVVGVRVAISLHVPDPEASLGQPVEVEGTVTPPHDGAVVALEYRRPELSAWQAGPQVSVDADGSYRASLTLPAQGVWHLRAIVLSTGDQDHLGGSTINDVFVNVR